MLGHNVPLSLADLFGTNENSQHRNKKMGFGDLKSRSGLEALNKYLEDKSYIEGYVYLVCPLLPYNILEGENLYSTCTKKKRRSTVDLKATISLHLEENTFY